MQKHGQVCSFACEPKKAVDRNHRHHATPGTQRRHPPKALTPQPNPTRSPTGIAGVAPEPLARMARAPVPCLGPTRTRSESPTPHPGPKPRPHTTSRPPAQERAHHPALGPGTRAPPGPRPRFQPGGSRATPRPNPQPGSALRNSPPSSSTPCPGLKPHTMSRPQASHRSPASSPTPQPGLKPHTTFRPPGPGEPGPRPARPTPPAQGTPRRARTRLRPPALGLELGGRFPGCGPRQVWGEVLGNEAGRGVD